MQGEEREGSIADANSTALEQEQVEQPGLDALEGGQDVEATDGDVPLPELRTGLGAGAQLGPNSESAPLGGEPLVRSVRPAADDGDPAHRRAGGVRSHRPMELELQHHGVESWSHS